MLNNKGANIEPWGTPFFSVAQELRAVPILTRSKRWPRPQEAQGGPIYTMCMKIRNKKLWNKLSKVFDKSIKSNAISKILVKGIFPIIHRFQ